MEKEIILKWLRGSGYGSGSGSGDGYGYGSGSGSGSGDGSGDGDGDGEKLIKIHSYDVFYIDNIPTVIVAIFGNYAKGFTVLSDYSLTDCYIIKDDLSGLFSHGKTLKEANNSLREKVFRNISEETKIKRFIAFFNKDKKYKGTIFFEWHNLLTGSCLFGRNQFVKDNDLSLDKEYTVKEFINLTKNSYGGETIKKLIPYYE